MTPEECRAYADECCPRTLSDGWTINPQHVAIEASLRTKHGHPSFIAELDGPGKFRDLPGPGELIQIGVTPDSYAWEISADGHVLRWIRSPSELGVIVPGEVVLGPDLYMAKPDEWIGPQIEFSKLSWPHWHDNGGPDVAPEHYTPGG